MQTTNTPKWVLLIALCALQLTIRARAAVDVGRVQTSTIGHRFFRFGPRGFPNAATDFLVDQDQSSDGGGVTKSFSANFDTNNQFVLTVAAPQDRNSWFSRRPVQPCAFWRVWIGRARTSFRLTFDDFPLGSDWSVIQNGYGRLQWNNFGVLNGSTPPETEGYRTGIISSPNVAFNLFGNPASISSAAAFDLKMAYLTAAFVNGLQIKVQGFVGATLTYDNTYSVTTTAPTSIHFNYTGVNQVRFIPFPGSQFVLDNLTVAVPVCASVDVGQVQTDDPGPSATVVPGTQPFLNQSTVVQPTVSVTLQPNGDATVTFTGSLQSASDLNGTFEDVPASTQGSYTIPRERLTTKRYFRAKDN